MADRALRDRNASRAGRLVGLYDVDSVIPNLALMKLAAWHRSRGDAVELYQPLRREFYDKVYASKVFSFSPATWLDDSMELGGTGSGVAAELPEEVDRCVPDYTLYGYPHSIGFTMRGCRFRCKFCVVPEKEGRPRPTATIAEIWTQRDSDFVVLLDNDPFGNPEWRDRFAEMEELRLRVNFSQGINIRILTDEQAAALSRVRYYNLKGTKRQVHFAWDRPMDERLILAGIERCKQVGIPPHRMAFYVLIGFDSTPEEDLHRVRTLNAAGCDPFIMPYDRTDPYQQRFARWVNHKAIFRTVPWGDYRTGVKRRALPLAGQGELWTE